MPVSIGSKAGIQHGNQENRGQGNGLRHFSPSRFPGFHLCCKAKFLARMPIWAQDGAKPRTSLKAPAPLFLIMGGSPPAVHAARLLLPAPLPSRTSHASPPLADSVPLSRYEVCHCAGGGASLV